MDTPNEETKDIVPETEKTAEGTVEQEVEQENIEMDARVRPIVQEMYKKLGETPDLLIGITETNKERKKDVYGPLSEALVNLMLEKHIRVDEVKYFFAAFMQPIELIRDVVEYRLAEFSKDATAHLFGRAQYEDVEVNDVHEVLLGNYPSPYVNKAE